MGDAIYRAVRRYNIAGKFGGFLENKNHPNKDDVIGLDQGWGETLYHG
jgi:hypothetical protein